MATLYADQCSYYFVHVAAPNFFFFFQLPFYPINLHNICLTGLFIDPSDVISTIWERLTGTRIWATVGDKNVGLIYIWICFFLRWTVQWLSIRIKNPYKINDVMKMVCSNKKYLIESCYINKFQFIKYC